MDCARNVDLKAVISSKQDGLLLTLPHVFTEASFPNHVKNEPQQKRTRLSGIRHLIAAETREEF